MRPTPSDCLHPRRVLRLSGQVASEGTWVLAAPGVTLVCCRPMVRWWHPALRALPSPPAPRFSRGSGFTTSPLALAPLGRRAPPLLHCFLHLAGQPVRCRLRYPRLDWYSAPGCPPPVLTARVCRLAAALAFTPSLLAAPRHFPRRLAAFPSAAGAPRAPPMGVEPPPPLLGAMAGPQLPCWACVIWPGRLRVHHPVAVPNWRLYSAYLGRPCGGSATSWFGAGLFCFNRLGPWD